MTEAPARRRRRSPVGGRPIAAATSPRSSITWLDPVRGAGCICLRAQRPGIARPGLFLLSAACLLVLGWWHMRRFGIALSLAPARSRGWAWPAMFALGLLAMLILSACMPLDPKSGSVMSLAASLHLLLLVPLSEEFFFRGLLLDHLRRAFSPVRAILLCSLFFALLHLPVGSVLVAGVLSLVGCALVLRSGGLGYTIQLHVAWNAFSQINRLDDRALRWTWAISAAVIVVAIALYCWARPHQSVPNVDKRRLSAM